MHPSWRVRPRFLEAWLAFENTWVISDSACLGVCLHPVVGVGQRRKAGSGATKPWRECVVKYLKTWFVIDFLSSVPFDGTCEGACRYTGEKLVRPRQFVALSSRPLGTVQSPMPNLTVKRYYALWYRRWWWLSLSL